MDTDRVLLPGADEQGSLDRRYDVRIARRIALLEEKLDALDARLVLLE
jgi:hypothetical protein